MAIDEPMTPRRLIGVLKAITDAIAETGAAGMKDMGKVIAVLLTFPISRASEKRRKEEEALILRKVAEIGAGAVARGPPARSRMEDVHRRVMARLHGGASVHVAAEQQ